MNPSLRSLVRHTPLRRFADAPPPAQFAPPGHFYSPIVSVDDVVRDAERVFGPTGVLAQAPAGVDMNTATQLEFLDRFEALYADIPFKPERQPGLRYCYENAAYSYSDAISLHCLIRTVKPARIVEVGSGYSSCATLDTNEKFFGNRIETTFIEPYPDLLLSLLAPGDKERIRVIGKRLQDVPSDVFSALHADDILFVDSTHVCKTGSDVDHLFAHVLPQLASGVFVHVHDIFFPFEYPREWVMEGRSWNEIYVLRAFLQFNGAFEIVYMNSYLQQVFHSRFEARMPLCLVNPGGSIWLRRK